MSNIKPHLYSSKNDSLLYFFSFLDFYSKTCTYNYISGIYLFYILIFLMV